MSLLCSLPGILYISNVQERTNKVIIIIIIFNWCMLKLPFSCISVFNRLPSPSQVSGNIHLSIGKFINVRLVCCLMCTYSQNLLSSHWVTHTSLKGFPTLCKNASFRQYFDGILEANSSPKWRLFLPIPFFFPLEVFCYWKTVEQKLQCSCYQFSIKKLQENEAQCYHINNILAYMCISYRTE